MKTELFYTKKTSMPSVATYKFSQIVFKKCQLSREWGVDSWNIFNG